jgi:hypothetical protein
VSCSGAEIRNLPGALSVWAVPSCDEHSLAEDQLDILALTDPEADPHVHLRPQCALAHCFLRRPLGRGDQRHRDSPAAAGDRVGV